MWQRFTDYHSLFSYAKLAFKAILVHIQLQYLTMNFDYLL